MTMWDVDQQSFQIAHTHAECELWSRFAYAVRCVYAHDANGAGATLVNSKGAFPYPQRQAFRQLLHDKRQLLTARQSSPRTFFDDMLATLNDLESRIPAQHRTTAAGKFPFVAFNSRLTSFLRTAIAFANVASISA